MIAIHPLGWFLFFVGFTVILKFAIWPMKP